MKDAILSLSDAGTPVAVIAQRVGIPPRRVYAILKAERPNRTRTPRRPTSNVPDKIRGLAEAGIIPSRIAFLCGVSRAYVYQCLGRVSA